MLLKSAIFALVAVSALVALGSYMALARLQIEMTAEADGLSYKEAKAANHRATNDSDSVLMNINLLKVEAYARRRGLSHRFAWASWLLPRSSIAGIVFGLLTLAVMSQ